MENERYTTKQLSIKTWNDFEKLCEKHNGIWNGCWCLNFHEEGGIKGLSGNERRDIKKRLVEQGRAFASLVYDGKKTIGWCQFGRCEELPRIKHKKEYFNKNDKLPDWRITCFFVDSDYRKIGITRIALSDALKQIKKMGGGVVESYPEEVDGRNISASFLYNSTLQIFEDEGFEKKIKLGQNHWVVVKKV
jgi:ribosomal protein S18 acetylase RimI-like enzyme